MSVSNSIIGIMAVIIIAILAIGYITLTAPTTQNTSSIASLQNVSGKNIMAIQLTDPPVVPSGTQSLVINYNSLSVHARSGANAGWVQSNDTGSVNLLSLLNISQTLGNVSVSNETAIDMVRFYVSSAVIKINNVTYNVTLPSNQITAKINGNASMNKSDSVLLSLSPTVVEILASNQTIFVMVPSVRAILVSNGTANNTLSKGARQVLKSSARAELERIKPNITITNATLLVSGNNTKLSLTVKNNANQSVLIKRISLSGNISTSLNTSAIEDSAVRVETELRDKIGNSTACVNVSNNATAKVTGSTNSTLSMAGYDTSAGVSIGLGEVNQSGLKVNTSNDGESSSIQGKTSTVANENNSATSASEGSRFNSSELGDIGERIRAQVGIQINSSVCATSGLPQFANEFRNRSIAMATNFGLRQADIKQIHFLVSSNGTLSLPYALEDFNATGYALQSGQSYTFVFNGAVVTSNGGISIAPIVNSTYTVEVGGENDASASISAIAS